MAILNGYSTLAELKAILGIPTADTGDDSALEDAVEAASRNIDGMTGWLEHGFWVDGSVADRKFWADDPYCCQIPEGISTVTGLVVKLDTDLDGTFETMLTINTDFLVAPVNAAANTPAWPYTEILFVNNYVAPRGDSRRPGVQVTAKFGWTAVPDDVKRACLLLARDMHMAKDANYGVAGFGQFGAVRIGTNRMVEQLLAPFKKVSVG